jgi:exosortase
MNTLMPLLMLAPSFLAMAWLVTKVSWFWNHRPDLQFGWVVLMLCGYLFFEAWEKRPALRTTPHWGGILLAIAGAFWLFVVQIYQAAFGVNSASTTGLSLGVLMMVLANLWCVFGGLGMRHFAFSFCFILIALPLPGAIHSPLVNGLQRVVTSINVELLNLLGIPAVRLGSIIKLPTCAVGVDEACSGIRSLQSTIMATLFIGYLTLKNNGSRAMLLFLGIGLAVLGNLIRSMSLTLAANARGSEGVTAAHDMAGWSILIFTVTGVVFCAWGLSKLEKWRAAGGLNAVSTGRTTDCSKTR